MGDLIVMTRPATSSRRPSITGADAEILFFTGVRYMRMPDVEPAASPLRTPRVRSNKPRKPSGKRTLARV